MTSSNSHQNPSILLTGATGYIGGRLLKELENLDYSVSCLTRRPGPLQTRVSSNTQVFKGDVLDATTLDEALKGIDVAYYLVHSMGSKSDFEEEDRAAAINFSTAAKNARVKRIIYLGGLGSEEENLSPHLRSRLEVGCILREGGVPTIELKASIIIGSGSLSFEMIRNLVERLPIMVTPQWVRVDAQPIFVDDILRYLIQAINLPLENSRIFEVGGADVISYGGLMQEYARQRKLKRIMLPVPFLTPWLSSLWLNLITPLYARIGRKLIDSIQHASTMRNHDAQDAFSIKPVGVVEAMEKAIKKEEDFWNETQWSDALSSVGPKNNWGGVKYGNRIIDHRSMVTTAGKHEAFAPIRRIGGNTGWYFANTLWRLRGFVDYLFGGVGLRRVGVIPTS